MKKIITFLSLLLMCMSCAPVVTSKHEIGDYKFEISFSNECGCDVARISGKQLDSALWVKSYNVIYEKDKVTVNIKKVLKKTGMSGSYFIEFPVSNEVEKIYLGPKDIIWQRD